MFDSKQTPARIYATGMGDAVADRTINRKITENLIDTEIVDFAIPRRDDIALDDEVGAYAKSKGLVHSGYVVDAGDGELVSGKLHVVGKIRNEKWEDVAHRVAVGNSLLGPAAAQEFEYHKMHHHLRQASILMSGRHLQHGDETQPTRPMEVFTNCSTSAAAFLTFYLLLNGSGVGRAYDNDMMVVDWAKMPIVVPVVDMGHADVQSGEIKVLDRRSAQHLYLHEDVHVFEVPDSREGWAKAIEQIEVMAYEGKYHDSVLILDFSKVRPRGSPIAGMQNRPASGPGPLIDAIQNIARLRSVRMDEWRQCMYVDHYLAECVLVGGARRAARMATKTWRDANVFDFINVKRPLELHGKSVEEIIEYKKSNWAMGFLWSSNNSVTCDDDFWERVKYVEEEMQTQDMTAEALHDEGMISLTDLHAWKVLQAIAEASYADGTGEPGIINQDRLTENNAGFDGYADGLFAHSSRYKPDDRSVALMKDLAAATAASPYKMITNPCGEISILMLGAYCVIADVVPFHATSSFIEGGERQTNFALWDDDAEDAFRTATRALIRTNLMDCLYAREVKRTNRIGVGITGFHEWAWARFSFGWKDIVNENRSLEMWLTLSRFKRAIVEEATRFSNELGVTVPHTNTTMKPAGTTSKLFGLTEGAHLPSMREFLRWVQFRNDDPLIAEYAAKGYPVKRLTTYNGTTVVGFPTQPVICRLGMGDKLVTAAEATPEEQYEFLRLLEKYWIQGVEADGKTPLAESGNQVSYTLKYNPSVVDFETFKRTLIEGQSSIRCCSVMPQTDSSAYEYQPEQPVTKHEYEMICAAIEKSEIKEEVGMEHVKCDGACPVDFKSAA